MLKRADTGVLEAVGAQVVAQVCLLGEPPGAMLKRAGIGALVAVGMQVVVQG